MGAPETLWYGSVLYGIRRQSCRHFGGKEVYASWASSGGDTSKEAYDNADEAVNRGNPTPEQRRLNERRAKVAGSWGEKARAAQRGELGKYKKK